VGRLIDTPPLKLVIGYRGIAVELLGTMINNNKFDVSNRMVTNNNLKFKNISPYSFHLIQMQEL
jgi:hypothetical protein